LFDNGTARFAKISGAVAFSPNDITAPNSHYRKKHSIMSIFQGGSLLLCHEIKLTGITMNTPLITWSCIIAFLIIVMITNIVIAAVHNHGHHRFIELGSENEEFYVPGDRRNVDEHDDEDF